MTRDPLARPYILDPPRPGISRLDGIVILDVDGCINRLDDSVDRSTLPTVDGDSGRDLPIDLIDDEVIEALHSALSPTVRICWLTTWSWRVARLEPLLGGRLSGGFIGGEPPHGTFVPESWKLVAATKIREAWPLSRCAWIEDESVPQSLQRGTGSSLWADDLLVAPRSEIGLTLDDARRVAEHIRVG